MKVMTDHRCRLQSRDLLKPNTPYDGQRTVEGKVVFCELVPLRRQPANVRLVKKGGYTVAVSDQQEINEAALKEALAEFP
jgi:hypothetical protein